MYLSKLKKYINQRNINLGYLPYSDDKEIKIIGQNNFFFQTSSFLELNNKTPIDLIFFDSEDLTNFHFTINKKIKKKEIKNFYDKFIKEENSVKNLFEFIEKTKKEINN